MKDKALKSLYVILKSYAGRVIKKHNPFIVAITGSVGKTSTKEAIYKIMKEKFGDDVRATAGNLNAEIGIPLTILGYSDYPSKWLWPFFLVGAYIKSFANNYPKYLVVEMGIEHPGDMGYFGSIIRPDIAVITAATPAHVANFESVNEMQEEKFAIRKIVKEGGLVVYNGDDQFLSKQSFTNALNYSINNNSNFKAQEIEVRLVGNNYQVKTSEETIKIDSKLVGKQMIYVELAAIAVAKILKIDSSTIQSGLSKINQYPGRVQILEGVENSTIIDDTYNSNPASAKAALDLLSELKSNGRKIAILGNMNELGTTEKRLHMELGAYAKGKCDIVLFAGPNAEVMQEGFGDKKSSKIFSNRNELISELDNFVYQNDIILVKASQNGNYFEEVVKFLMKDKSKARRFLVRQSSEWMKKKI